MTEGEAPSGDITRHSLADRLIHWSNAVLWLALLATGLALFDGEHAPLGQGYSAFVRDLAGGGPALLALHLTLGLVWLAALALYILTNRHGVIFFLRHVFRLYPGDGAWLCRRPFMLALGKAYARKWGISTHIPPQAYYNVGQRAFAAMAVFGCLLLACTGLVMYLGSMGLFSGTAISWCVTLHFGGAGLVFFGLIIHVYMAALVPDERPGLLSMFNGKVSEDYARGHHGLWHAELERDKKGGRA